MDLKNINHIGYACLNNDINPNTYKTCRLKNVSDDRLIQIIAHNLNVLEATIDYNIQHNIKLFRLSSSIIPFGSSPINQVAWQEIFHEQLARIKTKIELGQIRISVHPGQYTIINSNNDDVVKRSIADLEYHVDLLECFDTSSKAKIVLHIGGIYDSKEKAMQRFIDVYHNRISNRIKKHLVIENDDKSYNIEDVLNISKQTKIPVIFDNLHHEINQATNKSLIKYFNEVMLTWKEADGIPKIHYSQQNPLKKKGSHSETVDLLEFYTFIKSLPNHKIDIMFEVKDKNQSVINYLHDQNNYSK